MSTYNGERFLKEQIESVMKQTGVEVTLLIRDDGSHDNTVNLIKDFQKTYCNIVFLKGENCGSALSFLKLLNEATANYADYDFFAFCDQDDVWKDDKLISAVTVLENQSKTSPCLYLGAYQMVDINLNNIVTPKRIPQLNLPSAIASNIATGCTMVFNYCLAKLISTNCNPKNIIMHDYWIYLVCLAVGGYIYYDKIPHILYRQHNNNVIGGLKDSFLKKWFTRISKFFKPGDCFKSKLAGSLLTCYGDEINNENKKFLYYVSTSNKWNSKYHLLRNRNFRGDSLDTNLQIFGLIITGKF